MFELLNKDVPLPKLYPKVERKIPTIADKGYDRIDGHTLRRGIDIMPQIGPQEKYVSCQSDLIFFCGDSQIGKTYGVGLRAGNGLGRSGFKSVILSFQLNDVKKGSSLLGDMNEIWGKWGECEVTTSDYPTFSFPQWNSNIQLRHCNFNVNNPDEWGQFKEYAKKVQASNVQLDEITSLSQFRMLSYWFARNRDGSGNRLSVGCTFNYEHEHFTTRMLCDAGYVGEDWYIKPEMVGVETYFYVQGDDETSIIWGRSRQEVIDRANIPLSKKEKELGLKEDDMILSFTLITGETSDNRILLNLTGGRNIAGLHATGGTQRDILRGGYLGPVEKTDLTITRAMIHNLWENPESNDENMYATLDVSGGTDSSDNCPMVIWKGLTIVAIKLFKGTPKELETWIQVQLREYGIPIENFAFDATGIGFYLKSYTNGIPVTANKKVIQEYDEIGNPVTMEQYYNLRSQLMGKAKVLFEKGELSVALDKDYSLPYGKDGATRRFIDILFDEMNIFSTMKKMGRIYYRLKSEYKEKFKSSPDLMDAIILRMIFELDGRAKKQLSPPITDDAYSGLNRSWGRPMVGYGRKIN